MRILWLLFVVGLVGCGSPPADALDETPLTVEQWKALPATRKYEIATFDRLKAGDPRLQDQRTWDRFTKAVIVPARKKDHTTAGPRG